MFVVRRLPSRPPTLPGFTYIRVLGSGGFADVFLYEQNLPRRHVAVKVMLSEVVDDHVRQLFQAEANLMAQLSSHPSILTVYGASVSSDGRPYLVMELCSSSLSQRYRSERLPVAEVLRVAVKIGSAIETAHRSGVLHRDIKPSNILLTAYGHPVLSDFGIAGTLGQAELPDAVGMSIPWSAPEMLMDESSGTVASEVWSFAATVYSLLAGRSPFEQPGESNKSTDLITRINRARPVAIGRPDVPVSLERTLSMAMSRKPGSRQASVLEVVRELQSVETEIGVPQTPVEVEVEEWATATVNDLEERTRIRVAPGIRVSTAQRRSRRRNHGADLPNDAGMREDVAVRYVGVGTVVRESHPLPRSTGARASPRSARVSGTGWALIAAAVMVFAVGAVALTVLLRPPADGIPVVSDIQASVNGSSVGFTWSDPGLQATDSYQIVTRSGSSSVQRSASFTVEADAGAQVCITVEVNRSGRTGVPSAQKCADVPQ